MPRKVTVKIVNAENRVGDAEIKIDEKRQKFQFVSSISSTL